jgi:hypothetical protein
MADLDDDGIKKIVKAVECEDVREDVRTVA